jgi:hypothetical protein
VEGGDAAKPDQDGSTVSNEHPTGQTRSTAEQSSSPAPGSGRARIRLRYVLACCAVALATGIAVAAGIGVSPVAAQSSVNITGTWNCCGSGGAATQSWMITQSDSGSLSGSASDQGGTFATISGSVSGSSVTVVTTYTGSSYVATFTGTVSGDGGTMSGNWSSNASQSGTWTATLAGGTRPSSTQVNCTLNNPDAPNQYFDCTAQVADASGAATPQTPTGTVTFSVNSGGGGGFPNSNVCQLQASQSGPTAYCDVDYTPPSGGIPLGQQPPITANYSGDSTFAPSSGQPQTYTVTGTDTTSSETTTSETTTSTTSTSDCGATDASPADLAHAASDTCPVPVGKIIQAKGDGIVYIQHTDGTITQAGVGTSVYLGDIIITNPNTQAAIEFTIGGRVGINSDASVSIATERSVANYNQPLSKTLQMMVMGVWNMFPATAKLKEPVEIQTNGGVMGIKG